jgi:3'-5' exoribonuclease
MNELPFIKDIKSQSPGAVFKTVALVAARHTKSTKAGKPYLSIELTDRTGSFSCSVWSDNRIYPVAERLAEGLVVSISGQVDFFDNRLSPKIDHLSTIVEEQAAVYFDRLTDVSRQDPAAMRAEFGQVINGIVDPSLKALVIAIFNEVGRENFFSMPAAIAVHHSWRHGLVEHTLGMLRLAEVVLPLYPHVPLNRDLLKAGIALHDLCKVGEYSGGISTKFTARGRLLGHVSMIYGLIVKHGAALKVSQTTIDALGHIVLSHHGQLEHGAPVVPSTPEAVLVHQLDLLDSRMGAIDVALRSDGDKEVTPYVTGLQTSLVLIKATSSDGPPATAAAS